ncbi:MAG: helix-turn-helix domain-containing protein [Clostridiales bacterium]|nr:helix-turn-helix domain-containing protein [Clostridiales bacterium]
MHNETPMETKFDMEKAKKISDIYTRSTGIDSFIIDESGKVIYRGLKRKCNRFCRAIKNKYKDTCNCSNVHLYGSYQAERFGGKYIFFCPLGLTHWVAPINHEGFMQGALVGGPVLMVKPEDFLLNEIIEQNIMESKDTLELEEYLQYIPIVEPDRVTSLSELLFINACYIMKDESQKYAEDFDSSLQQSAISEYIHLLKEENVDSDCNISYPIERENELLSCVAIGDKVGAQEILNEILGYIFFSTGSDFETIRHRTLELTVLLSRAALEGGAEKEEIFGLNNHYIKKIYYIENLDELNFWLSKILIRFTDCVFNFKNVKNKDTIYRAIEYVNQRYMEKITLEDVSNHVHLSSSYFSKLFKDETGYNFSRYLNRVRIEKSKKLLLNREISIVDISNFVGFEDQSYFTRVFKEMTGNTPGRFRESRRR